MRIRKKIQPLPVKWRRVFEFCRRRRQCMYAPNNRVAHVIFIPRTNVADVVCFYVQSLNVIFRLSVRREQWSKHVSGHLRSPPSTNRWRHSFGCSRRIHGIRIVPDETTSLYRTYSVPFSARPNSTRKRNRLVEHDFQLFFPSTRRFLRYNRRGLSVSCGDWFNFPVVSLSGPSTTRSVRVSYADRPRPSRV